MAYVGAGYIYGPLTLPAGKVGPEPPVEVGGIGPNDWNTLEPFRQSASTAITAGDFIGVKDQATAIGAGNAPVAPAGAAYFLSSGGMPKFSTGLIDPNVPAYVSAYNLKWDATDLVQPGDTSFSQALNRAIALATAAGGGEVYVPRGSYNLDTKVLIAAAIGVRVIGAGQNATTFNWTGTTTDPVFQIRNCQYCYIENCSINGNATHQPDAALSLLEDSGSAGLGQTACGAKHVVFGSDGIGSHLKYDVRIHYAVSDQDNSEHRFLNCDFIAADTAGCSIEGTQSQAHNFTTCSFNGTVVGVQSPQGGNYNFIGGSMGNMSSIGFSLGQPGAPINIFGVESEGCSRFLDGSGATGNAWQVKIIGCRIDTNSLNADRDLIKWAQLGGLTIEGNIFGSGTTIAGRPRINWNCTGAGGSLTFKNNSFANTTHLTAPEDPIHLTGSYGRVLREGNTYLSGSGFVCAFDATTVPTTTAAGASYTVLPGDCFVSMTDDATRTVTLPVNTANRGQVITIQDTSGSANAGHTITISPASGNIDDGASTVITPGTNKSKTMFYDGTGWWVTAVN